MTIKKNKCLLFVSFASCLSLLVIGGIGYSITNDEQSKIDKPDALTVAETYVVDVENRENYDILSLSIGSQNSPTSNIFLPDGKKMVMANIGGVAQILDADSGKVLQTFQGDTDWMFTAAFSPDGKKVVTGGRYNIAQIWDAESGEELHKLEAGFVLSVAFSPDGNKFATAGYGTVRIWDTESGEELRTLDVNQHGRFTVAFSLDGKKCVTAESLHARIWDVETGEVLHTLPQLTYVRDGRTFVSVGAGIKSAIFSPDGQRIVTSGEVAVRIWDAESGKELRQLRLEPWEPRLITGSGSEPIFESATFSPDGKRILAAHWDGIIRVWDAETGEVLFRSSERYHFGMHHFVVFSPDGKRIIATGHRPTDRRHFIETSVPLPSGLNNPDRWIPNNDVNH